MDIKFDFNDITLTPATTSSISSRSEVITRDDYGYLPLCTAPMDMVISNENKEKFRNNGIKVVLPRGEQSNYIEDIVSVSLDEIEELYNSDSFNLDQGYLIDIANGHMQRLELTIKIIKESYPDLFLMVGNIANPETYRVLSDAGADAIRCSIGSGNSCTTSANTSIHYPVGSLIKECFDISCTLDKPALIIADGGMRNYSDIIKAIALGADAVMIGGLFNKCIESAGDNYLFNKIKVPQKFAEWLYTYQEINNHKYRIPIYKKMRGMSTKEVQQKWGNTKLKTSEGIIRRNKVEYSLTKWVENFEDYLKSAMSYTNCRTIDEFKYNVKFTRITENAFKRFSK